MHISKTLRAAIVFGALATGGAVAGIAGAAAAPTSSTTTTRTPSTPTTPTPSQKSTTPQMKGPCPNMGAGGSGSSGGSYTGPPPGASSAAGYEGPGPSVTYQ